MAMWFVPGLVALEDLGLRGFGGARLMKSLVEVSLDEAKKIVREQRMKSLFSTKESALLSKVKKELGCSIDFFRDFTMPLPADGQEALVIEISSDKITYFKVIYQMEEVRQVKSHLDDLLESLGLGGQWDRSGSRGDW